MFTYCLFYVVVYLIAADTVFVNLVALFGLCCVWLVFDLGVFVYLLYCVGCCMVVLVLCKLCFVC